MCGWTLLDKQPVLKQPMLGSAEVSLLNSLGNDFGGGGQVTEAGGMDDAHSSAFHMLVQSDKLSARTNLVDQPCVGVENGQAR